MSTSCAAGGSRGIAFVGDSTLRHVMHGLLQNEWQLSNRTALASIAERLGHRTFVVELQHTARFAFTYVPMPHLLRSIRDIERLPPPACKVIAPDSASRAALAAVEYGLRQIGAVARRTVVYGGLISTLPSATLASDIIRWIRGCAPDVTLVLKSNGPSMHASRAETERVNHEIGEMVELVNSRDGAAHGWRPVLFWDAWSVVGNASVFVKTWKADTCKCHFAHVFAVERGLEGLENERIVHDLITHVPCMLPPANGAGRALPQWCLRANASDEPEWCGAAVGEVGLSRQT